MLGILRALATTARNALRTPVTVQYPDQTRKLPGRNRGLPLLTWDHEHDEPICIGCRQCAVECPVECITVVGPKENHRYRPTDHDEEACRAANNGRCQHISPRRTLPEGFLIDENRCMRCGLCEEVCPTDQERYGYQKAIVLGTGHLSIQSSVYDRSDNVLDLDGLTHHSRVLKLELNAVMGTKPPKEDLLVNSPEAAGLRLQGPAGLSLDGAKPRLMRDRSLSTATRFRIRWLKLYSRFWLLKRGLPLRSKPQTNGEAPSGEADSSADGG
ncbi:MAG: 4Fe-4S binding protein [Dehalococcoidia bacterium]|nr:4Fe-4S binding protein [Dehalococcoidia bacterium]